MPWVQRSSSFVSGGGGVDPRPLLGEKFLAFALQKQIAGAGFDEHAETSSLLDKLLVDQLLIGFENRERINAIFGRDIAHGGQRVAFVEQAVEDHSDDAIAKLAVNRMTVVPLTVHPVFQIAFTRSALLYFVRCKSKCAWTGLSPASMNVQSSM